MPKYEIDFHSEGTEYHAIVETHYHSTHASYKVDLKEKGATVPGTLLEIELDENWVQSQESKSQGILPETLINDLGEAIENHD